MSLTTQPVTIDGVMYEPLGNDLIRIHYSRDAFIDVPWTKVSKELRLGQFSG